MHLYCIEESSSDIVLNFSFCVYQKKENQMSLEEHRVSKCWKNFNFEWTTPLCSESFCNTGMLITTGNNFDLCFRNALRMEEHRANVLEGLKAEMWSLFFFFFLNHEFFNYSNLIPTRIKLLHICILVLTAWAHVSLL